MENKREDNFISDEMASKKSKPDYNDENSSTKNKKPKITPETRNLKDENVKIDDISVYSAMCDEKTKKLGIPIGWSRLPCTDVYGKEKYDKCITESLEMSEFLIKLGWEKELETIGSEFSEQCIEVYKKNSEFIVSFSTVNYVYDIYCPNWESFFECLGKIIPVANYFFEKK